jgi:hypothetical protein
LAVSGGKQSACDVLEVAGVGVFGRSKRSRESAAFELVFVHPKDDGGTAGGDTLTDESALRGLKSVEITEPAGFVGGADDGEWCQARSSGIVQGLKAISSQPDSDVELKLG